MKILLLEHPRSISAERCNDIANAPLSACLLSGYAAGMLKSQGYEVEIVEGYLEKLSYKEILERVRTVKPDVLGVHMVYHWKSDSKLYDFLENIKNEGIAPYITAYGFYPTFAYQGILQECPVIDSVILGEPELTFAELAEALSCHASPEDVRGLAYRDEQAKIVYSRRELVEDLDSLPFPVRTDVSFSIGEVNILGSRGCYGACTFCYINPFYGRGSKWRARSPENIVAEIDEIISERNMRYFYFTDPNFFGPGGRGQERALRLASLLKSRNIRFGIEARVNDIHDQTIAALVEAGLRHILIGLESGKDESLKRLNKMTTVAQNESALKILRKNGIEPNIGFIMFEPDSTLEDIRINFEFLKRNHLLKNLETTVNVLYHHQIILQGTKAYKMLQEEGRLEISPYSTYEASTAYANLQVATLAWIMRDITNYIFSRLEEIWSGKVAEPEEASEKYAKINRLLVEWFENILTDLENGKNFSDEEKNVYVRDAEKAIDEVLNC
ncbi:MAG: 5-methoxy-6-methylbenzimidazole methyltransferase [Clostridia bacterium]|nr:5-methoxy-6-methylbenzimidazole methyltransferase [Clostridia bacterium]